MADTVTPGALFDAPADGQLFTLPASPRPTAPAGPVVWHRCPSCGRDTTSPDACLACVDGGYEALALDVEHDALPPTGPEAPCGCTNPRKSTRPELTCRACGHDIATAGRGDETGRYCPRVCSADTVAPVLL